MHTYIYILVDSVVTPSTLFGCSERLASLVHDVSSRDTSEPVVNNDRGAKRSGGGGFKGRFAKIFFKNKVVS